MAACPELKHGRKPRRQRGLDSWEALVRRACSPRKFKVCVRAPHANVADGPDSDTGSGH